MFDSNVDSRAASARAASSAARLRDGVVAAKSARSAAPGDRSASFSSSSVKLLKSDRERSSSGPFGVPTAARASRATRAASFFPNQLLRRLRPSPAKRGRGLRLAPWLAAAAWSPASPGREPLTRGIGFARHHEYLRASRVSTRMRRLDARRGGAARAISRGSLFRPRRPVPFARAEVAAPEDGPPLLLAREVDAAHVHVGPVLR